jgi:hypothetical protein
LLDVRAVAEELGVIALDDRDIRIKLSISYIHELKGVQMSELVQKRPRTGARYD